MNSMQNLIFDLMYYIKKHGSANLPEHIAKLLRNKNIRKLYNESVDEKLKLYPISEVYLAPFVQVHFKNGIKEFEVFNYYFVTATKKYILKKETEYQIISLNYFLKALNNISDTTEDGQIIIPVKDLTPISKLIDFKTNKNFEFLTLKQIRDFEKKYIFQPDNEKMF